MAEERARFRAYTEDGPLAGDVNLTVEQTESDDWPAEMLWTTGAGADERHLYRFKNVAISSGGGVPEYEFVRTLDSDEPYP